MMVRLDWGSLSRLDEAIIRLSIHLLMNSCSFSSPVLPAGGERERERAREGERDRERQRERGRERERERERERDERKRREGEEIMSGPEVRRDFVRC